MPEYTSGNPLRDMLHHWKFRRSAFRAMAVQRYDDSPETNKTIMAMEFMLNQCIQDLEKLMDERSLVNTLARMMNSNKEKHVEEDSTVHPPQA